jgi:hypothetical protein
MGRAKPDQGCRQPGSFAGSLASALPFRQNHPDPCHPERSKAERSACGSDEYRKHKRNQDQATRQLDLSEVTTSRGSSSELSEFYPYRYFASEGFLPGYNFTRLPIAGLPADQ